MSINSVTQTGLSLLTITILLMGTVPEAGAHCDTMDGPVIADAKTAIESGDLQPVLKWIMPDHEQEIRDAFEETLNVRTAGPAARELADRYFFETLVRVHRAGEGAPYTGLKPAGAVDHAVELADEALQAGSPDTLVQTLAAAIGQAIRNKFSEVSVRKTEMARSVDDGRRYVEAYVEYVHFVEGLHQYLTGNAHGHDADSD